MRVVLISDTHNQLSQIRVPDGDVLIHCGDATGNGTIQEISRFSYQMESLNHPTKIFVPGNHDWLFEKNPGLARSLVPGVQILIDEVLVVDGIKFYGSPWQPEFCNWAFNLPKGPALGFRWAAIPDDTNFLITHCPPYGVRDQAYPNEPHLGCERLYLRTGKLESLKYHAFGHIHGSHGTQVIGNTEFINASSCTEEYKPTNAPLVIDV